MNLNGLNEEERNEAIGLYDDDQDQRAEDHLLKRRFSTNHDDLVQPKLSWLKTFLFYYGLAIVTVAILIFFGLMVPQIP